jgi:hypothetical protein
LARPSMSQDEQKVQTEEPSERASRKTRRWWRDRRYLAAIGGALAGVASFNPALNNWLTYRLESTKQEASRRDTYLDKAVDPQRNAAYRLSVLQFLVSTLPEHDPMTKWAQAQLGTLKNVVKLEELETTRDKISREIGARQRDLSRTKPTSPQWKQADGEIETLKSKLNDLKSQIDNVAAELHRGPLVVNPPVAESQARTDGSSQKGGVIQPNVCCITCDGITICGYSVQTECGSCQAGQR